MYDAGKPLEAEQQGIIYENAGARVFVRLDGSFPRVQGSADVPGLPRAILWARQNKDLLFKLYRLADYDLAAFFNEIRPLPPTA